MFKWLGSKLTKRYKEVPLVFITFDYNYYKENGSKGSCDLKIHPAIKDENVINQLNNLIDYIRDNHDMKKII